ncbi:hypothetical protein [Enterobacter kobei]|uniref:hypothetical protein n=1 Tax=Enterobacter kobei TaxID=208224 RepID=UPI001C7071FF|nr:hypothetical protein [Enterobacter kobei]MBW9428633.1 hypothetical protein [Enterobacter kobei]
MKNNTQPALKERIEKALEDFTKGRASMHVPPLDTDVDMVLAECSDRLSELEARCAALAVENAGLRGAIETHKHGFVRCNCCGDELMCHTDDVCRALDETQATESFLAEVRAQGVEMFADSLLCPDLDDTIREFAAQLRQEAAQ